ncbi:MAG: gamma carbonic anhydrase family protein [Methanoculleaceae archaeon]
MRIVRSLPPDVFIAGSATVLGDVKLDSGVSIWYGAVIRGDRDRICIGEGTNIQDNAVIHTSAGYPVTIGRCCSVGHGAIIHGCTIGDNVLVGMGAIVMNGAAVGSGSLIGAGALVTEGSRIPPGSVVVGVPGKVVRKVRPEERSSIHENARVYMELAGRYRSA